MRKAILIPSGIALLLAAAAAPVVPGLLATQIQSIDVGFEGLFSAGDAVPGQHRTIRLLVLHGIGRHCIGYADRLVSGIAAQAGLHARALETPFSPADCAKRIVDYNKFDLEQDEICDLIRNQKADDRFCQNIKLTIRVDKRNGKVVESPYYLGYLRTQRYVSEDPDKPVLELYELNWDPATRWAKSYYVDSPDREDDAARQILNRDLKRQIINESISDAVLYLGSYRPFVQYPVLMSFCKIMADVAAAGALAREKDLNCDVPAISAALQSDTARLAGEEITLMTHSLGTRIAFDALGAVGTAKFFHEVIGALTERGAVFAGESSPEKRDLDRLRNHFLGLTRRIFTLANQVPLLELGLVEKPASFERSDLGIGFGTFLSMRRTRPDSSPFQLVAFTDPNDLLSYNLKCWYYLHVLKYHDEVVRQNEGGKYHRKWFSRCGVNTNGDADRMSVERNKRDELWALADEYVRIADVTVDLRGFRYPPLFDDPASAHSMYFDEPLIHSLIACGGAPSGRRVGKC